MSLRRIVLSAAVLAAGCGVGSGQYAVIVQSNLVYATGSINAHGGGGTMDLRLDAYRPAGPDARTGSALVLVHGGGFGFGDRRMPDMIDAALYFAGRGWTCFSIDYRLYDDDPPAPFPIELLNNRLLNAAHAAMVDTKRAIRWVRAHAAEFGVDTNRVAALGHSAGAYCAIVAAVTDETVFANDSGTPTPDQWAGYAARLNAAIEVSGGLGYEGVDFIGPAFDETDPPLMIWHGEDDGTVPYTEAVAIHEECVEHGIPHRFFSLPGVDHGTNTWLALDDGRDVKAHGMEFLNLFFALHVGMGAGDGTAILSWPGVSNAVYDVRSATGLPAPFTNTVAAGVTATGDLVAIEVPLAGAARFFRLRVRSGQPGP